MSTRRARLLILILSDVSVSGHYQFCAETQLDMLGGDSALGIGSVSNVEIDGARFALILWLLLAPETACFEILHLLLVLFLGLFSFFHFEKPCLCFSFLFIKPLRENILVLFFLFLFLLLFLISCFVVVVVLTFLHFWLLSFQHILRNPLLKPSLLSFWALGLSGFSVSAFMY